MKMKIFNTLRTCALVAALALSAMADAANYRYTYHVIDNDGNEAVAVPRRQAEGAAPDMPVGFRSPLVEQYTYYNDATLGTELTSLPSGDADVWVRYTVKNAPQVDLNGDTWYNMKVNGVYFGRSSGAAAGSFFKSNSLSNNPDQLWRLTGNDPYNVKVRHYHDANTFLTFASMTAGASPVMASSGVRFMLLNRENNTSTTNLSLTVGIDETYNANKEHGYYALTSNNNVMSLSRRGPGNSGYGYRESDGKVDFDGGAKVFFYLPPYTYNYKVIDNSGNVALTYSVESTTLGLPDYLKSPLATNFTYYEEDASNPGNVAAATLLTAAPDHNATILVRYDYNAQNSLNLRSALDNNNNVATRIDLNGGTTYNLRGNDRWFKTESNGTVSKVNDKKFLTMEEVLDVNNQFVLDGSDPYAIVVRSKAYPDQVLGANSNASGTRLSSLSQATYHKFILLPHNSGGFAGMVLAGTSYPNPMVWDCDNNKVNLYAMSNLTGKLTDNGRMFSFSVVPDADIFTYHVVDPADHSIQYVQYTLVRELHTAIALPADRIRPYCTYDGTFYSDANLTQPITTFESANKDIYYTFGLTAEGQQIFTTDENDPQWLYAKMHSNVDGTDAPRYIRRESGNNRIYAVDVERVPDNAHQWAFVGNPYMLHIMNRDEYLSGDGNTSNYAAMSSDQFIDFEAGHTNHDWNMVAVDSSWPSLGNNSFVLRYHKDNENDPVTYYFSAAGAGRGALKVNTEANKYAAMNVFPVKDYTFYVHKHNGEVLVRTEAQAIGEPVAITPSSVLFRKYCNYSYYSSWDNELNVGVNPVTTYSATGGDIHVAYEVSSSLPYVISDSTNFAGATWYLMAWDDGNTKNYIGYSATENKLYKTGMSARPDAPLASDQFAFFGDPYNLKIMNRATGEGYFLGVDALGEPSMVKMSNNTTLSRWWQVTHTSTDIADGDTHRFMLYQRQGSVSVAGTRWYLDAGATYLQMKSAALGYGIPLSLELVNPTGSVTFHIYDKDHNEVLNKTFPFSYEVGDVITELNPEVVRGFCTYTYYDDSTLSGSGSATLSKEVTAAGVDIYAVYNVSVDIFTEPVYTEGQYDAAATFAQAKWFYVGTTTGLDFKYRHLVDPFVQVNHNHINADEKDPYLWAFVGDPYHVRVANLYSGSGHYLSLKTFGQVPTTRFNVPIENTDGVEWEIVPPTSSGSHDFAARVRGSYERDDVTPKYFAQYGTGNVATLQAGLFNLRLGLPAQFIFRIYDENNRWVLDAHLNHTYAVGDMVTGLPLALQRKYCTYEYYSEYNDDGVWDETKKFDTTVGAEATVVPRTVYVRYTVTPEGKALFSTADNPKWLNVGLNGYWSFNNPGDNQSFTSGNQYSTAELKKSYQWRFEGDPYHFMIYNRRAAQGTRLAVVNLPGVGESSPVGMYTAEQAPTYCWWALKLTEDNNPDRFLFKLSDPVRDWVDTSYLRVYVSRHPTNRGLLASRDAIWATTQPAADVVDVTYDIRNEEGVTMERRTVLDNPVGNTIDLDPRDKRYLVTAYHYFKNVNTDDTGSTSVGDDPAGDMEQVSAFTADMDFHTIFVNYDYDRDKFSNDEGSLNWLNWSFEDGNGNKYWPWWDKKNPRATLKMKTSQHDLDDAAVVANGGIWAIMGDPYRMRILNFAYEEQRNATSYDTNEGYMTDQGGFIVTGKDTYTGNDGSTTHWPAYWDELGSEYPKNAVWEYLINPANGKGYLAKHQVHINEVNDPVNSASTLVVNNGTNITTTRNFSQNVEFETMLKNVTELTYHVVIDPASFRPSTMPELTAKVYKYGVGSTLSLPRALRRQYLKYHYWPTPEAAQSKNPADELSKVIDEWDQQIEDVYVTYELAADAPFRFSTSTATLHDPLWFNIKTGAGRDELMQNQHDAGIHAHYTDGNEHPTYDFWWAVEGDPYGFRLMNRYAGDNNMKMAVLDLNEKTVQEGISDGGNARMVATTDASACNVFEMLIGGLKGHFLMRPVAPGVGALDLMSTTSRIPVQIITEVSQAAANGHVAANWHFEGLEYQLKQHLLYAGYGFGVNYDALYTSQNMASIQNILNDTPSQADFDKIEPILRDVSNFPDSQVLREGYYRLTPMNLIEGEQRYVSGYLLRSERTDNSATAGRLHIVDKSSETNVEKNVLFDPSSIFYIKPIAGEPGHYTMSTQGLFVNETFMSVAPPEYHVHITDLGAAVVQIQSAGVRRGYLSYEGYSGGTVSHNFELNQHSVTHLQDTKWRLQRVVDEEETLDEANMKHQLPLKLKLVDGGDGYYYSSLYVPYDVKLPAGASAYTCRYTTDDQGSRLTCYSVDYDNEAQNRDNDRFVPASTPVVVKVPSSLASYDALTSCYSITLTLPSTAPSATINAQDNVLKGEYLTQNLYNQPEYQSQLSGKTVYVLGVSSRHGIGFYKNANIDPKNEGRGNTYVIHNKAFYISTPYTTTAAPQGITMKMMTYGVDNVSTGVTGVKVNDIDWGRTRVFDLQGREFNGVPASGVYLLVTTHDDGTTTTAKVRF